MLLLGLAARNATRNVNRSLLTALMVVVGTAVLTTALAWIDGVFGQFARQTAALSGHVRIVDPEFAAREELLPLYENLAAVDPVVAAVEKVPGVVGAYPRIQLGATVTVGDEIGEVFGLVTGAPDGWYKQWLEVDRLLADGAWLKEPNDVVLGRTIASKAGAKVGDTLYLIGTTQDGAMSPMKGKVVGILEAGNGVVDQGIYLSLPTVQYIADMDGGATELLVYGPGGRSDTLREALAAVPETKGYELQGWDVREPMAGLLRLSETIRSILAAVIVFITALGVWNTMMMSVLERTGEIGVLRAMGLSKAGAVFLFVAEAVAIAALGGAVGVGLGAIGGAWLEAYGVQLGEQVTQNMALPIASRMYGDLSWDVVVKGFLLGLCMAIVGSAPPALRAASIQPVAAMRARR